MNFFFYNLENLPQDIIDDEIQKTMYCSRFNLNVENIDEEPYDYYVVPVMFRTAQLKQDLSYKNLNNYISSLKYFKDHPDKHIFILQSDYSNTLNEILSKYNVKIFCDSPSKLDSNIYPLPFFVQSLDKVKNIKTLESKTISEAEYDIVFHGCASSDRLNLRKNMLEKVKLITRYKTLVEVKEKYFWNYNFTSEEMFYEKTKYITNLVNSKFILCPRGAGHNSARFFEAIWFGRIPILISDNVQLPLETFIPWDDLIVRVSEKDMDIEEKVGGFLKTHNLEEVSKELKSLARKYLDKNFLPKLIKNQLDPTLDPTLLINKYSDESRYIYNLKHNYVVPTTQMDKVFFYRMDCLGGIPLVVFLYDLYGVKGVERYKKIKLNHCLHVHNGIYPLDTEIIESFCKCYIETLKNCTYIGCWDKGYIPELYLIEKYCHNKAVDKPYNSGHEGETIWFNKDNWYEKLSNKKILIISSHAGSMKQQWLSNRIFKSHGKNIKNEETGIELAFVKPPMSACGLSPCKSWVESLDFLKKDVDAKLGGFDLDLALISCGGYGASICDYVYQKYNKSVFYIGGALQLYFSIIGNRWIEKSYINEHWVKLSEDEIPDNAKLIEGGCYF
jgi:hypothetical protein